MHHQLHRIKRPETALFIGPSFDFDRWTPFRLVRALSGERCEQNLTMLVLRDGQGNEVKVSKAVIAPFPAIVTTVREYCEFPPSTTFDVDHSRPWMPGDISVRHPDGRKLVLPSAIIVEAYQHVHQMPLVAV